MTDYCAAMAQIEKRLDLGAGAETSGDPALVSAGERAELLALVGRMAEPGQTAQTRLELVERMRQLLDGAKRPSRGAPSYSLAGRETGTGHGTPDRDR